MDVTAGATVSTCARTRPRVPGSERTHWRLPAWDVVPRTAVHRWAMSSVSKHQWPHGTGVASAGHSAAVRRSKHQYPHGTGMLWVGDSVASVAVQATTAVAAVTASSSDIGR